MIEGWTQRDETLVREFTFRDFDVAIAFLDQVLRRAEDFGRRPDAAILWNRVRLTVRNPHHAGLTEGELRLAAKANAVIDEQLGPARSPVPTLVFEGDALVAKD
jgi:pterin-4a-carbinolamine dehydratase